MNNTNGRSTSNAPSGNVDQSRNVESSGEYESATEESESHLLLSSESSYVSAQREKCRNLVAYWFLGLTNNFAYVVMLSAAHDILSQDYNKNVTINWASNATTSYTIDNNPRDCNVLSTGTILLADIIPALVIKILAPFLCSHAHFRIGTVVLLCSISFLLVGFALSPSVAILGVICASASSGLGETTFLAYSANYHHDVVSTWSSGTGGAGLFGALSYAALTSAGLTSRQAVLLMLIVPVIMSLSFWSVLEHPPHKRCCKSIATNSADQDPLLQIEDPAPTVIMARITFDEKLRIIPSLFKYMVPLTLVYVAEYLINQGLCELVYFPKDASWISHSEQYRWYQVLYQIGVFISRSSVNLIHIKKIWVTAVLQWINVIIFLTGAIFWWFGTIWLAFLFILWEGLLGGAAYVNTFYKLSNEISSDEKEFALQMASMSDTLGITFAGFLAIPLHNAICNLPIL